MAWNNDEVNLTVSLYFELYKQQLRGEEFVKAEHHRDLASRLGRTSSAVEYKLQNISAVLSEMGYPRMQGYAPYGNYQNLLRKRVSDYLNRDGEIHDLLDTEAASHPKELQMSERPRDILEDPPERQETSPTNATNNALHTSRKIDYVERERRNRALGKVGEKYVVAFEKRRLRRQGCTDLAHKVEWSSENMGDGLGYDVRSFETEGQDRYIEVKTTNQGKSLPFYLTANELAFSRKVENQFYIYRLYGLSEEEEPSMYILNGPVDDVCHLSPQSFRASPVSGD